MITKFADVFAELKEKGVCKRMVAAWAVDEHTIEACAKASEMGFVKVTRLSSWFTTVTAMC